MTTYLRPPTSTRLIPVTVLQSTPDGHADVETANGTKYFGVPDSWIVDGTEATLRYLGEAIPVTVIHADAERVVVERRDDGSWLRVRPDWLEG